MSDHEEAVSDTGYDTPVPELDDHRHQSVSVPRLERPRRGTFDSLYGGLEARQTARGENVASPIVVRDFEEAIIDDDGEPSPNVRRGRPPIVDTMDERNVSPPNSVKAFAEARRIERELSFSEPKGDKKPDECDLHRTLSIKSHQSHRSRPRTIENDAASFHSAKTAEEDVCFPLQDTGRRKEDLYIDFEYLESFVQEQREEREAARRSCDSRVFPDMRQQDEEAPIPMVTINGDFITAPSELSLKPEREGHEEKVGVEPVKVPQQYGDPNRFNFFSSAWESTIHAAELGDLVLPGEDLRSLFTFPEGATDGVWWLNMNNPSEEEVRAICRAFGVHPLTIEDITTQEPREKIELFPVYYFACFRSFNIVLEDGEQEYEPFNIYVVVFREGTLSFSFSPNAHASHVRKRIAMLKDYVALSSDWICYALIDDIVDCFAPVIHRIELDTENIEDAVFTARTDDMHIFLRKIGLLRKGVMGLMRLLGGKADVLRGFTKRCNANYRVTPHMGIGLYLGDIQDHVITMMTNLGHFEKMLSRSHSNYLAQLSIDSISQGTSTNRVLSKITLLASIIVPLNVVTGLFGMNVDVPFRAINNLAPFFSILGTLLLFCVLAIVYARRMRLI